MTLVTFLLLKMMELLQNGVATHFVATPLFSIRVVGVMVAMTLALSVTGPQGKNNTRVGF